MALLKDSSSGHTATAPPSHVGRAGLWASCLVLITLALPAYCQHIQAPEPRVKAAFLYNFTKLVNWPTNAFASSNAPLVIGVLGRDPFGEELDNILAGRRARGHPLLAARYPSATDATNCQVLFISSSERQDYDTIFDTLRGRPILTVGDSEGFANQGMIELTRTNNHIGMRINLEAASRAGLQLSSRLIRLDRQVRPSDVDSTNAPPQGQR